MITAATRWLERAMEQMHRRSQHRRVHRRRDWLGLDGTVLVRQCQSLHCHPRQRARPRWVSLRATPAPTAPRATAKPNGSTRQPRNGWPSNHQQRRSPNSSTNWTCSASPTTRNVHTDHLSAGSPPTCGSPRQRHLLHFGVLRRFRGCGSASRVGRGPGRRSTGRRRRARSAGSGRRTPRSRPSARAERGSSRGSGGCRGRTPRGGSARRSMMNVSGSSNMCGSRLAAGNGSSTQSSFFIGQPWKSMSLATMRAIVTGA